MRTQAVCAGHRKNGIVGEPVLCASTQTILAAADILTILIKRSSAVAE